MSITRQDAIQDVTAAAFTTSAVATHDRPRSRWIRVPETGNRLLLFLCGICFLIVPVLPWQRLQVRDGRRDPWRTVETDWGIQMPEAYILAGAGLIILLTTSVRTRRPVLRRFLGALGPFTLLLAALGLILYEYAILYNELLLVAVTEGAFLGLGYLPEQEVRALGQYFAITVSLVGLVAWPLLWLWRVGYRIVAWNRSR